MSDSNPSGLNTGVPQQGGSPWAQPSFQESGTVQPDPQQPGQFYPQSGQQAAPSTGQQYQPYQQYPAGGQQAASPYQQFPTADQQSAVPYVQPGVSPYGQPDASAAGKWSGLAIAGFVLGLAVVIISLFSGIVVMAALPIALSARALVDIKRSHKKGKGLAIAGLVLGGISAILYIINIILS